MSEEEGWTQQQQCVCGTGDCRAPAPHTAGFVHINLHSGNVVIDLLTGECHIVGVPLYALAENPC